MIEDWTDFRQTVTRITVRWTVGLGLLFLLFGLVRQNFTIADFGSRLFGSFVVGLVMGVLTWARREMTSPLSDGSNKRQR